MASTYYTSDRGLSEYLLFHYGKPDEVMPWPGGPRDATGYPERSVSSLLDPVRLAHDRTIRALDLGCAVGRSTFELARHAHEVTGIDFSPVFIKAAETLRQSGSMPYSFIVEGQLQQSAVAEVPAGIDRDRVRFQVGDAMSLPSDPDIFDVVHMANLIDRLSDPARCLQRLATLMRPGGQLLLLSPYTWMTEYTPEANWIGGRLADGRALTTLDGLHQHLDARFVLDQVIDIPFLIREHARKYQWSVAQGTRWIRR